MHKDDERKWKVRYTGDIDGPGEERLAAFTGIPVDASVALGDEILRDLDENQFGVGWWADQLPAPTRILISDHLLSCARAISTNIFEAVDAHLTLRGACAEQLDLMQRGVSSRGGFTYPPPRGPYDDLLEFRVQASLAAVLRALGSALDCLGGCVVGVCGLPANIVRADLDSARRALAKSHDWPAEVTAVGMAVDDAIAAAGPPGWHDWLIELRNTVVHRGRRIAAWSGGLAPSSGGQMKLHGVLMLPASPGLTEVEAWVESEGYFGSILAEPAEETLDGSIQSTALVIQLVCTALVNLWRQRRARPDIVRQPERQWTMRPSGSSRFAGYQPRTEMWANVTSLAVADETERRLRCAALTGSDPQSIWTNS